MTGSRVPRRKAKRITDEGKIRAVLEEADGHELSRSELLKRINGRWTAWSPTDFDRKLNACLADDRCPIKAMPGEGDRVRLTGAEHGGGRTGSGLHVEARAILDRHGLPRSRGGDRSVEITANRRSGEGVWTTPDLVMLHRPPRAACDRLHTFEVEPEDGFDIRSVYQAHAHGWGADFSWVIFDRGGRSDGWDPSSEANTRTVEVARLLGIGLVSFHKPSVQESWNVEVSPKCRNTGARQTRRERERWVSDRQRLLDLMTPALGVSEEQA